MEGCRASYGNERAIKAYLEGPALEDACAWLRAKSLPHARESADEMIGAYYPGGLHFFIAEHLIEPPK